MSDEKFVQGLDILIQKYPARFSELVSNGDLSFSDDSPTVTREVYLELVELATKKEGGQPAQ